MEDSAKCDMLIGRILYLGVPVFTVILFMICGNSFVVLSILIFKSLRSIRTGIIASLALADLLVAITVLPFAAIDLICRRWVFPQSYCGFYIMLDFISCQSSIFHICLIAVEQYITISSPLRYTQIKRTLKIIVAISIVAIWTLSVVIAYYFTHYTEKYNTELMTYQTESGQTAANLPIRNLLSIEKERVTSYMVVKVPRVSGIVMDNNFRGNLNAHNYAFSGSGGQHAPLYVSENTGYLSRLNRHFQSYERPFAYDISWTPSNKRQYPSILQGSRNVGVIYPKLAFLVAPKANEGGKTVKAVASNLGDENCLYLSKLSTNFALLVFVGGFLIPMAVTVAVYWKIYRIVTYHVTSMISQYDATLLGQQKNGRKLGVDPRDARYLHQLSPTNSKVPLSWCRTKGCFFKSIGNVGSSKCNRSKITGSKFKWKGRTLLKIVNKVSTDLEGVATINDNSRSQRERPTTVNSISPQLSTSPNSLPYGPLLPKNDCWPGNGKLRSTGESLIINHDDNSSSPQNNQTFSEESIRVACAVNNNSETHSSHIVNDPVRYAKYTEKRKSINHDIISPRGESASCALVRINPKSLISKHTCCNNIISIEINNSNNFFNYLTDRYIQLKQPSTFDAQSNTKTNLCNLDDGMEKNTLAIPSTSLTGGQNQRSEKIKYHTLTNTSPKNLKELTSRSSSPPQMKYNLSQRSSIIFRGHFRRSKNQESMMYANIRSNRELVKEKKAIKTLGMVLGTFLFCWTPYFIVFLLQPYCNFCVPVKLFVSVTWLGYLNSALNPIIYAIYNKKFRRAFKALMMCQTKIYKRFDHID